MNKTIGALIYFSTLTLLFADVSISGNIQKAGNYKIKNEMSLSQVVEIAGGLSTFGHSVIVYRDSEEAGYIHVFTSFRNTSGITKSFSIKDGDVIFVTGKQAFEIKVPDFITEAAKAKNKRCYRIDYRTFMKPKKAKPK